MRIAILLLCLLAIPLVTAGTTSNWYYSGDTFKIGEVVYTVTGFDYTTVLLAVGSTSYVIRLGECKETALVKYCYEKTAYPSDTTHVKYQKGKEYFGHYLSIKTAEPTIDVVRQVSNLKPEVGDTVSVTVRITNKQDKPLNNIVYTETLPPQFVLTSGGNYVTKTFKAIAVDNVAIFSYSFKPTDFSSEALKPNVSFEYAGYPFKMNPSAVTVTVSSPLTTTNKVTGTINLGEIGSYQLVLANTDSQERPIDTIVSLILPPDLHLVRNIGFTQQGSTYTAAFRLTEGENVTLNVSFVGPVAGTYKIPVSVVGTIDGKTIKRYFNETVVSKADKIIPTIKVSTTRSNLRPGDIITVTGTLKNSNDITPFLNLAQKLTAPGLLDNATYNRERLEPNTEITEFVLNFTVPQVNKSTSYGITWKGDYVTQAGELFTFSTVKTVSVAPLQDIVSITRTVQPAIPKRGENITVTVSAKNVFNQYIGFSTYEIYTPLNKVSGITYSDNSLERNAQKQLYIYQLQLPMDYAEPNFTISTQIAAQDQDSYVLSTVHMVKDPYKPPNVTVEFNNTITVPNNTVTAKSEDAEETQGVLSSVWEALKRWFW